MGNEAKHYVYDTVEEMKNASVDFKDGDTITILMPKTEEGESNKYEIIKHKRGGK